MAHPAVRFSLAGEGAPLARLSRRTTGRRRTAARAAGAGAGARVHRNSLRLDAEREGVLLQGHAGLPTCTAPTAGGVISSSTAGLSGTSCCSGAVRAAYADVVPSGRHPMLALFVTCPPREVDVNVHPGKAEVRFRDPGLVRGLVVGALKQALVAAGHRAATTVRRRDARRARPVAGSYTPPGDGDPARPLPPVRRSIGARRNSAAARRRRLASATATRRSSSRRAPHADLPASRPPPAQEALTPARRGAGAVARHLHRRPDAGRPGHRRPARRP